MCPLISSVPASILKLPFWKLPVLYSQYFLSLTSQHVLKVLIIVQQKSFIICLFFFFSGSTERQILSAIEDIVDKSLPSSKLTAHFQDTEAAKLCILNKISFCEVRQKVIFFFAVLPLKREFPLTVYGLPKIVTELKSYKYFCLILRSTVFFNLTVLQWDVGEWNFCQRLWDKTWRNQVGKFR